MIKKIGFYLLTGLIIIILSWAMFCVGPGMIEIAMDALKSWKEIL